MSSLEIMSLASFETSLNSGNSKPYRPRITLPSVSWSLSPKNGDKPDKLQHNTGNAMQCNAMQISDNVTHDIFNRLVNVQLYTPFYGSEMTQIVCKIELGICIPKHLVLIM